MTDSGFCRPISSTGRLRPSTAVPLVDLPGARFTPPFRLVFP